MLIAKVVEGKTGNVFAEVYEKKVIVNSPLFWKELCAQGVHIPFYKAEEFKGKQTIRPYTNSGEPDPLFVKAFEVYAKTTLKKQGYVWRPVSEEKGLEKSTR